MVLIGVPFSTNVLSNFISLSFNFSGRPPNLHLALAATLPAADRSKIKLRSNSANAAKR